MNKTLVILSAMVAVAVGQSLMGHNHTWLGAAMFVGGSEVLIAYYYPS